MRPFTLLAAICIACVIACATTSKPEAVTPADPTSAVVISDGPIWAEQWRGFERDGGMDPCPRPLDDFDVTACQDSMPKDYGYSATRPMELGIVGGAGGRGPWFERLICPGGGWPKSVRNGSVLVTYGSTAALSGFGRLSSKRASDAGESVQPVDEWTVTCPGGRTFTVYNNLYRRGVPCPPRPLGVTPARAGAAYLKAIRLTDKGDLEDALAAAQEAVHHSPPSERYLSFYGVLLHRARRYEEAVKAFRRAAVIDPGDPYHRLHIAMSREEQGNDAEYRRIVLELVDSTPASHEVYSELLCRKSWILGPKDPSSQGLRVRACKGGERRCCDEENDGADGGA